MDMRRRTAHLLFAAAATIFGAVALYQGVRLQQALRVNEAIFDAQQFAPFDQDAPEAQFAQAVAWTRAGETEKALDIYKHLSQSDQAALSVGALYNLGNLHLREALKDGAAEAHRYLPLIELAKQRYREALRRRPDSWDARYNLEAALLLAPEADDPAFEEDEPSDQEDRVISTLPGGRIELP